MKKVKIIIFSVLFVAVLVAAALIFPKLQERYESSNTSKVESEAETSRAESEKESSRTESETETSLAESEKESSRTESEIETSRAESKANNPNKATDFLIYNQNGDNVMLSDFVGKPTVVNFWATWCGYCVKELPSFNKLFEEYKDKVNFVMLDLDDGFSETQSGALEFVQEKGYTFPVYFDTDSSATNAYSVTGIPMTLFVDSEGNLYQKQIGMMSEDRLRSYIEDMLEGEE